MKRALYHHLRRELDLQEIEVGGKPQVPVNCPKCHVDNVGHMRASFGLLSPPDGYFFHCLACGTSLSLEALAKEIGVDITDFHPENTQVEEFALPTIRRRRPPWLDHVHMWMRRYHIHPQRYEEWAKYKTVSPAEVDLFQLGVGPLPGRRVDALITPMFDHTFTKVQHIRGRSLDGHGGWQTSGGWPIKEIDLPLVHQVKPGDVVFVVENYVDGILVNTRTNYSAVASLSVSTWADHWTEQLMAAKPRLVLVAYDADLAGNGIPDKEIRRQQIELRLRKIHGPDLAVTGVAYQRRPNEYQVRVEHHDQVEIMTMTGPAGPKLVRSLDRAGLPAHLARWRSDQALKDVGDYVSKIPT